MLTFLLSISLTVIKPKGRAKGDVEGEKHEDGCEDVRFKVTLNTLIYTSTGVHSFSP